MKKIIFTFSLLFTLLFLFIPNTKAYSYYPIDEILSYDIYVNTNDDATLSLEYDIKWKVLDYDDDGNGVTWVNIGVPNKYVSNETSLSNSIRKIKYHNDGGNAVYRIDLNREFNKGEVIDIHFKYNLSHIFYEEKTNNETLIQYRFIPGWFDDIEIDSLTIYWNNSRSYYYSDTSAVVTLTETAGHVAGDYLVWHLENMAQGARTKADMVYELNEFPNINLKEGYSSKKGFNSDKFSFLVVCTIFALILIFLYIKSKKTQRMDYYSCRGFYPYDSMFYFNHYYLFGNDSSGEKIHTPNPTIPVSSGSGGHSGGHSCACACACACAGGGRAGCSRKDFYNTKVNFNEKE